MRALESVDETLRGEVMKAVERRCGAIGWCDQQKPRDNGALERRHVRLKAAAPRWGEKMNVHNNNTTTTENTQDSVIESSHQTRFEGRNNSGFLGLLRLCGSIHSHRISVLVQPLDKFKRKRRAGKIG